MLLVTTELCIGTMYRSGAEAAIVCIAAPLAAYIIGGCAGCGVIQAHEPACPGVAGRVIAFIGSSLLPAALPQVC